MSRSFGFSVWLAIASASLACFGGEGEGDRFSAHLTNGFSQVVLCNGNSVSNSSGVVCGWIAFRDGRHVADGDYSLMTGRRNDRPLSPGSSKVVGVPAIVSQLRKMPGEVSLRIVFARTFGEDDDRITIGECQFDLPRGVPVSALPNCSARVEWKEDSSGIRFECEGIGYSFSRRTGMLGSIRTGSWFRKEWLAAPMRVVALAGTNRAECTQVALSVIRDMTNSVVFDAMSEWSGGVTVVQRWIVRGDGALVCRTRFRGADAGYALPLAVENPLVDYFALGGKWGLLGFYGEEMENIAACHHGARSVSFDAGFDHLSFAAASDPFSFFFDSSAFVLHPSPGCRRSTEFSFVIRPEKSGGSVTCSE